MKKRIAFFVNSLSGGGAEKVMQTILRNWNYGEWDVTLYCLHREEVPPEYPAGLVHRYVFDSLDGRESALKTFRVKVGNRLKSWVYEHCSARLFYRLFIRGGYDVEVAFIEGYSTRIVSGSPDSKSRKIAWVHVDLVTRHWTSVAYRSTEEEKEIYRGFDTVVSVSPRTREALAEVAGPLNDSRVLYNPLDGREIRTRSLEQDPDRPRETLFCAVGRLDPQKGFDLLLRACRQLKEDGLLFHLWIVGEGEERSALESLIREGELGDRVTMLGYCSNPYPYMRKADWVVSSSRAEGHPLVLSESLLIGTPVVCAGWPGAEECLKNGEYGLIAGTGEDGLYLAFREILVGSYTREEGVRRACRGAEELEGSGRIAALERLLDESFSCTGP